MPGTPIYGALTWPEVTETASVNALIHASQAVIQVPSIAIRGGWRAREGVAD